MTYHGFRRQNPDETDMILAKIGEQRGWWRAARQLASGRVLDDMTVYNLTAPAASS
jgi:hypothetical protein